MNISNAMIDTVENIWMEPSPTHENSLWIAHVLNVSLLYYKSEETLGIFHIKSNSGEPIDERVPDIC